VIHKKKLENASFNIKMDPLLLIIWPLLFVFGYAADFLWVFLSIILHELGHVTAAIHFGSRLRSVKIMAVGLNASLDGFEYQSTPCRLLIYLSGPAVNLILAAMSKLAGLILPFHGERLGFLFLVNISLAVLNFLPVLPLDGGKILREIIGAKFGLRAANNCLNSLSVCFATLLICIGILQIISKIYNFSLAAIGIYILLSIKSEKTEAALMNVRNIINRRSRILKKGIFPVRNLVVIKSKRLMEVIKRMDFDSFHILYVADEDLNIMATLTEQQVIDGLLKHGPETTFEELLKKQHLVKKIYET